jgi:hypothetical protein
MPFPGPDHLVETAPDLVAGVGHQVAPDLAGAVGQAVHEQQARGLHRAGAEKHGAGALAVFDAALNIDHAARPTGRVGFDLGHETLGADLGPSADRPEGRKVTSMLALAPVLQPAWQKPRLVQAARRP